jgi:hypothetical protein
VFENDTSTAAQRGSGSTYAGKIILVPNVRRTFYSWALDVAVPNRALAIVRLSLSKHIFTTAIIKNFRFYVLPLLCECRAPSGSFVPLREFSNIFCPIIFVDFRGWAVGYVFLFLFSGSRLVELVLSRPFLNRR